LTNERGIEGEEEGRQGKETGDRGRRGETGEEVGCILILLNIA
jgi:hypothetical protein